MKDIPYKIYLTEEEMPRYWYNVRADMKTKPAPLLTTSTALQTQTAGSLKIFEILNAKLKAAIAGLPNN